MQKELVISKSFFLKVTIFFKKQLLRIKSLNLKMIFAIYSVFTLPQLNYYYRRLLQIAKSED